MTSIDICYSGGCKGADQKFGELAEKAGHQVAHFSFPGHVSPCKHLVVLNYMELMAAEKHLLEANKMIRRKYPSYEYMNNLLRRDYYQIRVTDRIYAVTYLSKNGIVNGGTGWAVTMGILRGVPEIYLFECKQDKWLKYVSHDKNARSIIWEDAKDVPMPYGKYSGIGSHDLAENGRLAIEKLYTL